MSHSGKGACTLCTNVAKPLASPTVVMPPAPVDETIPSTVVLAAIPE